MRHLTWPDASVRVAEVPAVAADTDTGPFDIPQLEAPSVMSVAILGASLSDPRPPVVVIRECH
jgi:hypothetical protein